MNENDFTLALNVQRVSLEKSRWMFTFVMFTVSNHYSVDIAILRQSYVYEDYTRVVSIFMRNLPCASPSSIALT
ncbi:hypothetical protein EVAR_4561_1 [Eumeta japonica]|uniref:Uncharacterized protein n=1 Tax=Eumeta variegata TaxID=151549 RepID=A0A4C1SWV4_EUMVA|nr:hypothetical protein EVAR_4561_1 [Eumeta japonica]